MTVLLLAIPLLCLGPGGGPGPDAMDSTREVDPFFVTLEIFQPLVESLPFVGMRATGVFNRRFGLEGSASKVFVVSMAELSALGVLRLAGDPFLLRAGVSFGTGGGLGGKGTTGFHAGASLLSGDEGDRVRVRLDYTYRWFEGSNRAFSTIGIGLVFPMQ
jgi:hypothetical protein